MRRGEFAAAWAISDALIPLLETIGGNARFLPLTDEGVPPRRQSPRRRDGVVTHVFRTTLAAVPNDVPFLSCDADSTPRNPLSRRVGVVCRGGDWDPRRDVPPELMATSRRRCK